jgi:rhamnulokinase
MIEQRYISIDLGAESGRVMLARVGENGIFLEEIQRFSNGPVAAAGTLYWDILRLWQEIQTGIAKITAENPVIAGIGIDSWGVDFGLLDGRGQLLANPVHYRDRRTEGMAEKFFARMPRENAFARSGIQTMELNTLFQLLALRAQSPAMLDHAQRLLFIPDLIAYWLTGRAANEYTIASTSQMLDAQTRQWSTEILAAIGVSPTLFPPMLFPGRPDSNFGPVQEGPGQAIKATGVPVLAVGSHDTASAVAAVPASGDDWLFLSSGTWSLLGVETATPVLSTAAQRYNVTNEGGVGGRIRLLKNIPGLWLLQECRRAWAGQGKDFDYKTLVQLAREAPAHLARLDLDDPAFLVPGNMPEKIAVQCLRGARKVPETPGQFARVILESLAVRYAEVAAMLAELTGRRFRTLHIVGGGSQNELLCQMAADATGLTVLAGPVEATALGNAVAQAMATGQIASLDAGRRLVAKTAQVRTYQPRST